MNTELLVSWVSLSTLHTAGYNPRRMNEADMAALKKSIQRFGFVDPIVVNQRDGKHWKAAEQVIVGGHQRVRAARELGMKQVPVVYVTLPPDEEKLLNLALNKIGGEFDLHKLAALLRELRQARADLDASGFSERDIAKAIAQAEQDLGRLPEDEVPKLPTTPRTKPGELVELGPHRLLCGDATKDLKRLLSDEPADLLWTDPPYGVDYVGKTREALRIQNDAGSGEALLRDAFAAADQVLAPGAPLYVAHPAGLLSVGFISAFVETGWLLRQSLVWVKDTMVLGHGDYHYRHEAILYGFKPGPGRLGRGGRRWHGGEDQSSVFEIPRPKTSRDHPTMKPVALVEACLKNSSTRGALVLDPFGGSGTTLMACHRLGRRACLMEIDPRYCDVIRQRWEQVA